MIRIVLADDHSIVRSGFRLLLESDPEIEVIGEAADGIQAYNLVSREHPDVLLLDISMPPGQSGLTTCCDVVRDYPETKVIILTMFSETEYLRYTLNSGVSGFLVKNATADELKEAVHQVVEGNIYVHSSMMDALEKIQNAEGKDTDDALSCLTPRELDILRLIARGYTNKQISEQVYLSVKTVEAHRAKIYSKLGFDDRSDAVDFAIKHKILTL